jgi:hypothetical protein
MPFRFDQDSYKSDDSGSNYSTSAGVKEEMHRKQEVQDEEGGESEELQDEKGGRTERVMAPMLMMTTIARRRRRSRSITTSFQGRCRSRTRRTRSRRVLRIKQ